MTPFEEKQVLESFRVLVDTREQPTKRARRRYESFGVPYDRVTLDYGDYAYNATLPDGSMLYDIEQTIRPACVVERKMDLDELAQCFTRGRDRFQKEFERATKNGSRIFLIVENASWENLLNGRYKSRFGAKAFEASIDAWTIRYNLTVMFCKEETTGQRIRSILYRDLKERLERGEFDL